MPDDLPKTDVDTFTRYEWQMSSAVRPEWEQNGAAVPLYREAYFGRTVLAEPAQGAAEGPPYVVCTYPAGTMLRGNEQDEITLAFRREEAEKAVRRYDERTLNEETQPTLFEQAE
jgi:hypothetical protein